MKFLHGLPSHMHSMGATTLQTNQTTAIKSTNSSSTYTPSKSSTQDTISLTPIDSKATSLNTSNASTNKSITPINIKTTTTTIRPTTTSTQQSTIANAKALVSSNVSSNSSVVPRQQYNELNAQLNKLKAEHKNCSDIINRCKADNVDKQKQIIDLQKRVDILSSNRSDASKMQSLLDTCERMGQQNTLKIRDLEAKLQAKVDTCNQLAQQVNTLTQASLNNSPNDVQALLNTCNNQLALLQQQISDLTNRNQSLLDENSNLQAQISSGTSSTSSNMDSSRIARQQFALTSSSDILDIDSGEFDNDLVNELNITIQETPNDTLAIKEGLRNIDNMIGEIEISNALKETNLEKSKIDIANLTKEKDALSKQLEDAKKSQASNSSESNTKQKQLEKDLESARLKGNIGLAACGVVLGYATYKYVKAPK